MGFDPLAGSLPRDANCACTNNCMTGFRCYPPVLGGAAYELRPAGCNPKAQACTVRATLEVDFPGNNQGLLTPGSGAYLDWTNAASSPIGSCGYPGSNEIFVDKRRGLVYPPRPGLHRRLSPAAQPAAELNHCRPLRDPAQCPLLQEAAGPRLPGGWPRRHLLPRSGWPRCRRWRQLPGRRRARLRRPRHRTRYLPLLSGWRRGPSRLAGHGALGSHSRPVLVSYLCGADRPRSRSDPCLADQPRWHLPRTPASRAASTPRRSPRTSTASSPSPRPAGGWRAWTELWKTSIPPAGGPSPWTATATPR